MKLEARWTRWRKTGTHGRASKALVVGTVTIMEMDRDQNKFNGPNKGRTFYFPWFPGVGSANGDKSEKHADAMVRRRLGVTA